MKKEPRWFQKEAIKAVMLALKDGETPYLDLMCGLGKSFIMAVLTDKAMNQGLRVLQLVPGQELVTQNFNELLEYRGNKSGLGIVSAALQKQEGHAQAVVAMINSFVNKRFKFGKFDVLIIDECDLVTPDPKSMYQKVITHLKQLNPNLKIIGLTGSPYRMGIGAIENDSIYGKATFTKCVWSSTDHIHRLIEEGYLSRIESISSDIHADMDRVRVNSNGDYDTELMSVKFDEIISHAVPDMIDKFNHYRIKTALIFASSIANSKRIITEYKAITGLDNMRIVHGEMDKHEREKILKWLKNDPGNRYIVNVGILTRGYNYPQLDCVVFMRATKSLQLYIQCVGRAIRPHDEKDCGYVIDYGTNIERLGPIDDITPPKPKQERGESPKKQCTAKIDNRAGITKIIKEIEHKRKYGDDCNYPNILSAKNCALCGAEFIPDEESPGNYSMRTKAEILRMRRESKYVKHDIKYVYFEPKVSKSGHLMALAKLINFDNITVHTVFLCLEHPGQAQGLAHRFIKSWLKNPAHFDELKQDGLNVENFLLLVQDDAILSKYFKKIKSITIEPQGSITNLVEIEYAI